MTAEAKPVFTAVPFAEIKGWADDDHAAALAAFQKSCAEIKAKGHAFERQVRYGGKRADWLAVCESAAEAKSARQFFEENFTALKVADPASPEGLFTGYYEPEAEGSLTPGNGYEVPIYRKPDDLVGFDAATEKRLGVKYGRMLSGKPAGYLTRREIEKGALHGRGLEIVWLKSWVDAFFIHVQGSGRIELPDGEKIRIALRNMREAGIRSFGFFILGYPGDTVASLERTVDYAIELDPDFANFYPAVPYPGTDLHAKAIRDGLLASDDWTRMEYSYYLLSGNGLNEQIVMAAINRAKRRFYLRPGYLTVEKLAIGTRHGVHIDTGTEDAVARYVRKARLENDALAVITRRRRIGDVVPGGGEIHRCRVQPGQSDVEDTASHTSSVLSVSEYRHCRKQDERPSRSIPNA